MLNHIQDARERKHKKLTLVMKWSKKRILKSYSGLLLLLKRTGKISVFVEANVVVSSTVYWLWIRRLIFTYLNGTIPLNKFPILQYLQYYNCVLNILNCSKLLHIQSFVHIILQSIEYHLVSYTTDAHKVPFTQCVQN